MRYCKYLDSANTPRYATVESGDFGWYTVAPMDPPEEDLAARFTSPSKVTFERTPLAALQLLPPVTPSKILCVGRNYKDHAAEMGNDLPKEPLLFLKPPSTLLAPGGSIILPAISTRVDYEGELAIVIGRRCRNLGPHDDVAHYIRGYTLINDVTARDLQKNDGQWTRGKGFDTFCPAGPVVSTDINPLKTPVTLTTRLNGEVKQHGSTASLIFDIPHLLRYITAFITLEPGDIIPTGTPAGVGPLAPGDSIEVEIEGLGILKNSVTAEKSSKQ